MSFEEQKVEINKEELEKLGNFTVMVKKERQEVAPGSKKNKKKNKKRSKQKEEEQKKEEVEEKVDPSEKKLQLSYEALQLIDELEVKQPVFQADLGETMAQLDEKIKYYEDESEKHRKERLQEVETLKAQKDELTDEQLEEKFFEWDKKRRADREERRGRGGRRDDRRDDRRRDDRRRDDQEQKQEDDQQEPEQREETQEPEVKVYLIVAYEESKS